MSDIPKILKQMEVDVQAVRDERLRQLQKWGPQNHDDGMWLKILVEEVGELAKGMLEKKISLTYDEAIQVSAVALAIAQAARTKKPV